MHPFEEKKDGYKDFLTLPRMNTWIFRRAVHGEGSSFTVHGTAKYPRIHTSRAR